MQLESAEVRANHDTGAILLAAAQTPTKVGLVVRKLLNQPEDVVEKALRAVTEPSPQLPVSKKPIEALAFILNNNITKNAYCQLKQESAENFSNIWPNYNAVSQKIFI